PRPAHGHAHDHGRRSRGRACPRRLPPVPARWEVEHGPALVPADPAAGSLAGRAGGTASPRRRHTLPQVRSALVPGPPRGHADSSRPANLEPARAALVTGLPIADPGPPGPDLAGAGLAIVTHAAREGRAQAPDLVGRERDRVGSEVDRAQLALEHVLGQGLS